MSPALMEPRALCVARRASNSMGARTLHKARNSNLGMAGLVIFSGCIRVRCEAPQSTIHRLFWKIIEQLGKCVGNRPRTQGIPQYRLHPYRLGSAVKRSASVRHAGLVAELRLKSRMITSTPSLFICASITDDH